VALSRARAVGAWTLDRGVFLVACLVAGSAALYASYDALVRLAVWAGWSESAAPGLPLTVDVIALAAGVRYVRLAPDQGAARAQAFKGVVWSAVVSVVGNAIVHAGLTDGWSAGHRVIAVAVSAVPAVALGYVVHLVAAPVVRPERPQRAAARHARPAPRPTPPAEVPAVAEAAEVPALPAVPASQPVPVGAPRPGSIKARGLALIETATEAGNPVPSTDEIKDALGCTLRHAQNIVRAWEESA
jgi:hypothetical protein